jgi:hypothetical protein
VVQLFAIFILTPSGGFRTSFILPPWPAAVDHIIGEVEHSQAGAKRALYWRSA